MKHNIKNRFISIFAVLAMLMSFMPIMASAEETSGDFNGIQWQIMSDTLILQGSSYSDMMGPGPWGEDFSMLNARINSIGDQMFSNNMKLRNVRLENANKIGMSAFENCTQLSNLFIQSGGALEIGMKAFANCNQLNMIQGSFNISALGDFAFENCSNLQNVMLGGSLTEIKSGVFSGCSRLSSINLPTMLTSIGNYAFSGCSNLTKVNIPENVTTIEDNAFSGCTKLESVTIPKSVTEIGADAFKNCSALTQVTYDGTKAEWDTLVANTDIGIDDSVTVSTQPTETEAPSETNAPAETEKPQITSGTCGENATWTLDDKGTLTISGTGDMNDYDVYFNNSPFSGNQNIKSVVIENGVTNISEYIFSSCPNLTSIKIPSSVTNIKEKGINSSGITSIDVDENNAYYCSVDGNLFSKDKTQIIKYAVGKTDISYTIPNGVTSIADNAFSYCDNLTSVIIPEGVTSIGDFAFGYCDSLVDAKIPDGVIRIGEMAFDSCKQLVDINIPESVTSIGYRAFYKSGYYNDMSNWGSSAILYVDNCLLDYQVSSTGLCYIKEGTRCIADSAFTGSRSIFNGLDIIVSSFTIPDSVTSIGNYAFGVSGDITSFNVDEKNPCYSSVDGVLFNKDKTELLIYAGRKSKTNYSIPAGVTSIASGAFNACDKLTSITIPETVTKIEGRIYGEKLSVINYLGTQDQWEDIEMPEGAFSDTVNINCRDESVVSSGTCGSNLTWTLNDKGTLIISGTGRMNDYTSSSTPFKNNLDIKNVVIKKGVTSVGSYAFSGCKSMTKVEIPPSLTYFGANTFYDCSALEGVYITDLAKWCEITSEYYHSNPIRNVGKLYINNELATNIVIPDTVTKIGKYAFANCKDIKSITIPNSVSVIDEYAFSGAGVENIEIPDSVSYFGRGVFSGCKSLKTVKLGKQITSIGQWTFNSCSELTDITFDGKITSIGPQSFMDCGKIESMVIPNSVTYIGQDAFSICSGLTNVTIGRKVQTIGSDAFSACEALKDVYYLGTKEKWDKITINRGNYYLTSANIHYIVEPLEVNITKAVNADTNTVTFTVETINTDRADELEDINLFAAEYDNGALIKVTIGTKSALSGNSITITAPLLSSQDYKYMLWDENNSPLMSVITDINEEI